MLSSSKLVDLLDAFATPLTPHSLFSSYSMAPAGIQQMSYNIKFNSLLTAFSMTPCFRGIKRFVRNMVTATLCCNASLFGCLYVQIYRLRGTNGCACGIKYTGECCNVQVK